MDRSELKLLAKQQIQGNIGTLLLINICMFAISYIAQIIVSVFSESQNPALMLIGIGLSFVISFVTLPLALGLLVTYINLSKGIKPNVNMLFSRFSIFLKAFGLYFMTGLFIFL